MIALFPLTLALSLREREPRVHSFSFAQKSVLILSAFEGLGSPVANHLVPALTPPIPDFTMAVTPSSQTVNPGASGSYTVSLSPLLGFNEGITLSLSGLPAGASGSFSANPVAGASGNSLLTVTTSASTPSGSYPLTVTGVSVSGETHTVSATLVVVTPNFSISATPSSQSVKRGASAAFTVTISPSAGFNGAVALSVSGLAGTLSPPSINGSGSATLTIGSQATASRGNYTLKITGTSGSLTHSTSVTLKVTN